jgi:trimethylamine--corrinoid protein Co-methyltransferase
MTGLNLIHDVGYMDGSMACGVDQLVLGDEIIGMVKRFMRGVEFSSQQIARDLVSQVGPGGEFLSQNHTLENFKNELWQPSVFTRQTMEAWREDGEKDTMKRTREKIHRILETHTPQRLPDVVVDNLERIKSEGEKALTGQ